MCIAANSALWSFSRINFHNNLIKLKVLVHFKVSTSKIKQNSAQKILKGTNEKVLSINWKFSCNFQQAKKILLKRKLCIAIKPLKFPASYFFFILAQFFSSSWLDRFFPTACNFFRFIFSVHVIKNQRILTLHGEAVKRYINEEWKKNW
jgi:hypothetical protein